MLVNLVRALILFAGAIIPFFWVPIVVWLAWRLIKRREDRTPAPVTADTEETDTIEPQEDEESAED